MFLKTAFVRNKTLLVDICLSRFCNNWLGGLSVGTHYDVKKTLGMSVFSEEYTYPILFVITEMIVKGGLSTTLNPKPGGVRGHRL
jgi:hypothetical protein